jgi:predicted DNA-binding transcriptional regulator AlpA
MARNIPPGAKCLTPQQTCVKLGRKQTWLRDKIKNDPTFPKPLYLSTKSWVLIEQHLDDYLAERASTSPPPARPFGVKATAAASRVMTDKEATPGYIGEIVLLIGQSERDKFLRELKECSAPDALADKVEAITSPAYLRGFLRAVQKTLERRLLESET